MADTQVPRANPFRTIVNKLGDVAGYVSSAAILLATLVIVHQVVVRYVFNIPTIWQVEFAVYLLMGATFIGAAYGLKEDSHINIELVTSLLPPRKKRILKLITSLLSLFFCLYIAWKGGVMWVEAYEGGWDSSSLWSVPLIYPYSILPIGMGLTSLQYMVKIADQIAALKEPLD
jgi:TRAP-type C4-dicarboxylate transport system permease small subunit